MVPNASCAECRVPCCCMYVGITSGAIAEVTVVTMNRWVGGKYRKIEAAKPFRESWERDDATEVALHS